MIDFSKLKTAEQKQAEKEQAELDRVNAEARRELAETDWYFLRELETGKPMPANIKAKRGAARGRVK